MLDDDLLESLPDDPDEAFGLLYKQLSKQLAQQRYEAEQDQYSAFDLTQTQHALLVKMFACIDAFDIKVELDRDAPYERQAFEGYYRDTISRIEYHITKTTLERSARSRVSPTYILSPALKLEMHHHIQQIRTIIASTLLTDNKRDALSRKLNAFCDEVDRDRTKIDALASALVWVRKEVAQGAKDLEPAIEKLDKMFQSMSKATEFLKFPSKENTKRIPPPPKRIEGPKRDLDDEIPF
jgi:hypothetical protein